MTTSRCRSCGADIFWVKTVRMKNHPLDSTPSDDGEWVITHDAKGTPMMVKATPMHDADAPHYRSHFSTCPNADAHRRKGGAS